MNRTLYVAGLLLASCFAGAQSFTEGFEGVGGATLNGQHGGANLEAAGWSLQNTSAPRGSTDWFQGLLSAFAPHSGTGYIAANYDNVAGYGGASNWLLTPTILIKTGSILTFWTRAQSGSPFPDNLEVRLSTNGSSVNVGPSPNTVGDFGTLLTAVNPGLLVGGYPTTWTQVTVTYNGPLITGRFALRYFVKGAGAFGMNSDYIGIDDLTYIQGP